jgi:hypothetical protein
MGLMPSRLAHSARFALPTFVAVLLAGLAYEQFEAFVRRDVPAGVGASSAVAGNMATWALIAFVMAVVSFLLHLSDVVTQLPGWRFAWLAGAWSAVGAVGVVVLLEAGQPGAALATALVLAVAWLAGHRRVPGWPGRPAEGDAVPPTRTGKRDLR